MPARHALAADLATLATTLADAFDQDPVMTFIFPHPPVRARALPPYFRVMLDAGVQRGHTYTVADGAAAAIWAPPDVDALDRSDGQALRALVAEHHGPEGVVRMRTFAHVAASSTPTRRPTSTCS